jgi:transcriptional regulator with XRE-family HTH domain
MMRLRNRLQSVRTQNGHSIREAARATGVDAMALSEIERGLRSLSARMAVRLASYLKTSPMKLLHEDAADRLDRYLDSTKDIIGSIDTETDDDGVPIGRSIR